MPYYMNCAIFLFYQTLCLLIETVFSVVSVSYHQPGISLHIFLGSSPWFPVWVFPFPWLSSLFCWRAYLCNLVFKRDSCDNLSAWICMHYPSYWNNSSFAQTVQLSKNSCLMPRSILSGMSIFSKLLNQVLV
jgi:hypothetical protein